MSPAKNAKPTRKTNQLTIDFSGVCTLLLNQKTSAATVQMVDLASAGFQRHFAALGLVVSEDLGKGVKGPDADAAVSLPGVEDRDIGLWDLLGTEIEVLGGSGKLTVDDSKIDPTKKPGAKAESIQWLPNIGFLTESSKLDALCPIAASIEFTAGHITAASAGESRKVEFLDEGTPIGPARYYLSRFRVRVPFDEEVALRLDRQRVLRFTRSMAVMISNTCVCGLGVAPVANDFYAHYDVVRAKRRPKMQLAGPKPMIPSAPEWCWPGFVQT
jgi:hypothetical protein